MAKKKTSITSKQRKVLDEIFGKEFSTEEILQKHNVSCRRYCSWFMQAAFAAEFTRQLNLAWINSKVILARYATFAVAKLIELTQSEKPEISRKACNDILSYQFKELQLIEQLPEPSKPQEKTEEWQPEIPDGMAAKMLEMLADEKRKMEN